jgi:thiol-disulfide isomerase/thioredoxin
LARRKNSAIINFFNNPLSIFEMRYIYLLFILLASSCIQKSPETTGFEGKTLPSFKLLLTEGNKFIDTKDIPVGQHLVVFLYGPSCPYCRAQLSEFIKDYKNFKNTKIFLVTSFPLSEVQAFNREFSLNKYENIISTIDAKDYFQGYIKAIGVPYIAIYDKQKRLVKAFSGETNVSQIKRIINRG